MRERIARILEQSSRRPSDGPNPQLLRITDIDHSVAFYKALGFEEVERIPIRDEAMNLASSPAATIAGHA